MRQMLAFLGIAGGVYDLIVAEEDPADFLRRLSVGHYRIGPGFALGYCRRGSLVRQKFGRGSAIAINRKIGKESQAVAMYRDMLTAAITEANAKGERFECFSLETAWSDYLLVTELQKTGTVPVYMTNDGTDFRESKTACRAFMTHCHFEDLCLSFD